MKLYTHTRPQKDMQMWHNKLRNEVGDNDELVYR